MCPYLVFLTFISPSKVYRLCNCSVYGKTLLYLYTFQILYLSFSYTLPVICHTYTFYVLFSRASIIFIVHTCWNKNTRQKYINNTVVAHCTRHYFRGEWPTFFSFGTMFLRSRWNSLKAVPKRAVRRRYLRSSGVPNTCQSRSTQLECGMYCEKA